MKIAVLGLGYVGIHLAVAFKEKGFDIIGFDIDGNKIGSYNNGIDVTSEVGNKRLINSKLKITSNTKLLCDRNIYIVAVPTPVTKGNAPDLVPISKCSEMIGKVLKKGDIVIFESTVYPSVTENICGKILSYNSGLVCGEDFYLGYSPERINQGDKEHRLENIIKVVSGQTPEVLEIVAQLYEKIIDAGVHRASSIMVAEASKVIENAQRDINIAFINELSNIFNLMNIDTEEVLKAAGTKWNFLNFKPGLVGGHCIGVDPFYLAHCAQSVGYPAKVILSGREVNDSKAFNVVNAVITRLSKLNKPLKNCRVAVCGLTFKENCQDTRNSKVFDMILELKKYNVEVICNDDLIEEDISMFGVEKLVKFSEIKDVDVMLFAVAHDYIKAIPVDKVSEKFVAGSNILIDLKWIFKLSDTKTFDYFRF